VVVDANGDALTRNQAVRRERVIKAAMELAAEGGYDAVQMRDVASRAHVALGTIYRYFASKDHLLAATLVEFSRDIQGRIERQPPRGTTAADRVVDVVRRAMRAIERQPRLGKAMVTAISSPDPAVTDCQAQMTVIMMQLLAGPMGEVEPARARDVVTVLSHVWFSSLLGWVNDWSNVGDVGDELESAARLLLPA
jgi:TetR/AcrR family transcriptional regulator, cholesterol catabolism regulator